MLTFTAGPNGAITMSVAGQTDKSLEVVCQTWYDWARASEDIDTLLTVRAARSSEIIAEDVRKFMEGRLHGKPPTTNLTGKDLQHQIAQAMRSRPRQ